MKLFKLIYLTNELEVDIEIVVADSKKEALQIIEKNKNDGKIEFAKVIGIEENNTVIVMNGNGRFSMTYKMIAEKLKEDNNV